MKWERPIIFALLIVGLLAFLAVLALRHDLSSRDSRARMLEVKTQLDTLKVAAWAFEVDHGYYPKSLAELVQPSPLDTRWKGRYLEPAAIPLDPWGHAYLYTYPGRRNANEFDLMSAGPDGQAGTDDDITNWQPKR